MCVAHHPRLRQHGIRSPTSALGGMLRGGMPRVPSMSIALAFCALSSFPVASGFRAAGIGAFGCANRGPPVARWTCEAKAPAASESYTIVPSQLAESGGGWTIQGVKPVAPTPTLRKPPKAGTVWARPRPKVGEVQSLGVGSFGKLYLATDLKTGEEVAVKAETDLGKKTSPLRQEAEGGPGIPSVYWVGKRELAGETCNILVMDLLGPDMEDLLEMMRTRQVSEKTGLMLTLQMLECLEHIHGQGVLHRDIKPENFLMGVKNKANNVYLIDYGMAGSYVDEMGNHKPKRKQQSNTLRGTLRYASVNKHDGWEQSRRDDLEELCFVAIYLMAGGLPWQVEEANTFDGLESNAFQRSRQMKRVRDAKANTPADMLCRGLPPQIAAMLEYTRGLDFEQEPDYEWMKAQVQAALDENGYAMDGNYDWGNKAQPVPKKRFGIF